MKVLITGIAGFIGANIAQSLIKNNVTVVGIDNYCDYYDPQLKALRTRHLLCGDVRGRLEIYEDDISTTDNIRKIVDKHEINVVLHLAAYAGVRASFIVPEKYVLTNIVGFQRVVDAIKDRPDITFIYASSSSVYGSSAIPPFSENESCNEPLSVYAATKRSNELMAKVYHSAHGRTSLGIRFFSVYGQWGRPDMAYFLFAEKMIRKEKIYLNNMGDMQRDYTYIDDVVKVVNAILNDYNISGAEIVNVGSGRAVSLSRFINILQDVFRESAEIELTPNKKGESVITLADVSKLREMVGYVPSTAVEDGLEQFGKWFKWYIITRK